MSNTDPSLADTIKRRLSYTIPGYGAAKELADVTGVTPRVENAVEGAYDQFTKNGGLLGSPSEPQAPAQDDSEPATPNPYDIDNTETREPVSVFRGPNADQDITPKPPTTSGSFSVSAQGNPFEDALKNDYNDQLAGLEGEAQARQDLASGRADALGNYANEERNLAQQSADQAHGTYDQAVSHLEELGQLAQDYANQKIDPDKFWREKNVGGKIATVMGAMLAGLQGGPKGAMDYVNNLVNRSIAIQQEEVRQKGRALYEGDNLFHNFLKASGNEQEADDKTRAALLDAAMTDVARASTQLKGNVEQQQMRQFIAALKAQRDGILARLRASASVSAGAGGGPGAPSGWLQTDGKNIVPGLDGQSYFIPNPSASVGVMNNLTQYRRMLGLVQRGQELLKEREAIKAGNLFSSPVETTKAYYNNLQEGSDIDGLMREAFSKLAQGRGLPTGVEKAIREVVPDFGSPLAGLHAARLPEAVNRIRQFSDDVLTQNGARPVDYTTGPGRGKHAGELTNYVRPASPKTQTPQAATVTGRQRYGSFRPGQ